MVNVICVHWGSKYNINYVCRLYSMVKRNLENFRFVCFGNNNYKFDEFEYVPLSGITNTITGWWTKLSLFQDKLYDLTGPTLFLDLDLIVVNRLEPFFEMPGNFCIIDDWAFRRYNINKYNSSVFRFNIGEYSYIWEKFRENPEFYINRLNGDQDFITENIEQANTWPNKWCLSFKSDKVWKHIDPLTKIVVFHGNPKPHEAISGYGKYPPTPWISNYWR